MPEEVVKNFILLYPDGRNRRGNFVKKDSGRPLVDNAEALAAAKILECENLKLLEITLGTTDGIFVAHVYFDPDGEAKGLAVNTQVHTMIRDVHKQTKIPMPDLGIHLFGPVLLVPGDKPVSAPSVFVA